MSRYITKYLGLSLAGLVAVGAAPRALAAEPVTTFFPQATEYKGGFAAYGGTKIAVRKEEGVLAADSTKPVAFVYWFYTHKPIAKQTASVWQDAQVRLEARSLNGPLDMNVSAAWRGRVEPAQMGPASKVSTTVGEDWTTIDIPLPAFENLEGDKLTGLLFEFAKPGSYEVRSIQIVGQGGTAQTQPATAPEAAPEAAAPVVKKAPKQEADVAAMKIKADGEPDPAFLAAHERNVNRAKKGGIECLLLGDSITLGWNSQKDLAQKYFGAYQTANFGVGGDGTQHVLWRIQNGEVEGITPKAVVLMIGTNNTNWHDVESTSRGVKKIVETLREKLPSSKVLLLGALPRGEKPNPYRAKNEKLNETLRGMADNQSVVFLDMGDKFVQADGTISKDIMPDYLHLSRAGYEIWGEAMAPTLAQIMQ